MQLNPALLSPDEKTTINSVVNIMSSLNLTYRIAADTKKDEKTNSGRLRLDPYISYSENQFITIQLKFPCDQANR